MQTREEKPSETTATEEEWLNQQVLLHLLAWDYDSSFMWGGYYPRTFDLNDERGLEEARKHVAKIAILNAVVPPQHNGVLNVEHVDMDTAKKIIDKLIGAGIPVESYIGHEATAQLLTNLLGIPVPFNRGMYKPQHGDLAFVFRLKKRLEKPEDIANVTPDDLDVLYVYYA